MENFIAKVGAIPQKGLRFSDSNFREEGRGGILIHEDKGVKGTIGCVGVVSKDWGDFYAKWESIPKAERPKEMVSDKGDLRKYASLDKDLIKNLQNASEELRGLDIKLAEERPAVKESAQEIAKNSGLKLEEDLAKAGDMDLQVQQIENSAGQSTDNGASLA